MPPLRSIRIIRKICKNRKLRSADVAKTLPWEPAASTAMEAISTMISVGDRHRSQHLLSRAPRGGLDGPIDRQGHVEPWEGWFSELTLPTCGVQERLSSTSSPSQDLGPVSHGFQLQVSDKKELPEGPTLSLSPLWPRQKQFLPQTQLWWACPPGLTNHTERLPGKLEPAPPASIPAAAARSPDPHKVLNTEYHDGHDFLGGGRDADEDQALGGIPLYMTLSGQGWINPQGSEARNQSFRLSSNLTGHLAHVSQD